MQAQQIMTTPVVTVGPDTGLRDAAALLLEHRITAVPVLDADGELVGMVSEGDLVVGRFSHDSRSELRPMPDGPSGPQTVGEVMTTPAVTLGPSTDAADLAQTMLDGDVRSIPIVEGAVLVGIVSRRDLLRILVRDDDAIRAEVLQRLADHVSGRDRWDVQVTDGRVLLVRDTEADTYTYTRTYTDADTDTDADIDADTDTDDGRAAVAIARTVPGVAVVHLARQPKPIPG